MVARTVDTTHMGLDLNSDHRGPLGTRKWLEPVPTKSAALLRSAEAMDFFNRREDGPVTAAMPRTPGVLAPRAGADCCGFISPVGARRFFAFGAVQALGEI